ncbi:MAG TPA: biotin/lipoyl-containing protein [Bryobacteraceae bacterium]|nr:biotin/lipoyl-containing protein [Bryobacteraceae bacterium]
MKVDAMKVDAMKVDAMKVGAMKVDVVIDGRPARLTIDAGTFRYQPEDAPILEREFSIAPVMPGAYSVLIGDRSYDVVAAGPEIRVNGKAFAVEVFDPRSMRGRKRAGLGAGRHNVAAMMPGKVVRLLIAKGDLVEEGQGLVVVEAMKMQNEMKSPKAGRIVEVKTQPDATVVAGEVLLVIE